MDSRRLAGLGSVAGFGDSTSSPLEQRSLGPVWINKKADEARARDAMRQRQLEEEEVSALRHSNIHRSSSLERVSGGVGSPGKERSEREKEKSRWAGDEHWKRGGGGMAAFLARKSAGKSAKWGSAMTARFGT